MLVSAAEVRTRFAPASDSSIDAVLEAHIADAQDAIARETSRVLELAEVTRYLDGAEACGECREILYLPAGLRRVVWHGKQIQTGAGPDVFETPEIVVEEDGLALSLSVGFSEAVDVLVVGANDDEALVTLIRGASSAPLSWSCGRQNVKLVFKLGWTAFNVPRAVARLIAELAFKLYGQPALLNVATSAKVGEVVAWDKALSETSRKALEWLRSGV